MNSKTKVLVANGLAGLILMAVLLFAHQKGINLKEFQVLTPIHYALFVLPQLPFAIFYILHRIEEIQESMAD
ncbi:hypothetical protein [Pararhodonellum marinum]|uniref:hypothetical protein n=1 Tax=Pararhodonellum marinum TaxID=2755358 RepID=UPI001890AED7|nr:hypothetical protein [Pararhodonellum marinum]